MLRYVVYNTVTGYVQAKFIGLGDAMEYAATHIDCAVTEDQ